LVRLVRNYICIHHAILILTKIGWPTDGSTYEAATPSVANAQTYWSTGICGILAWGVKVFSFEAFDEPWKPKSTGQDGKVADETHWGVYNADRTPKYKTSC
jgi:glucan 1,3-beta-glucosidase